MAAPGVCRTGQVVLRRSWDKDRKGRAILGFLKPNREFWKTYEVFLAIHEHHKCFFLTRRNSEPFFPGKSFVPADQVVVVALFCIQDKAKEHPPFQLNIVDSNCAHKGSYRRVSWKNLDKLDISVRLPFLSFSLLSDWDSLNEVLLKSK